MYDVSGKVNRQTITKTKKVSGKEVERFPNEPYDNVTLANKYFSGNMQALKDCYEKPGGPQIFASLQMRQNYFYGMQYEAEQAASWGMKLYIDIEGTPWLEDKVTAFMMQNPYEVLVEWDRTNPPRCFEDLKALFEEKMSAPKANDKSVQMSDYSRFVKPDFSDLDQKISHQKDEPKLKAGKSKNKSFDASSEE